MYQVETILSKKYVRGRVQYLVKWLGYGEEEATWEGLKNLRHVKYLIDAYEGNYGSNSMSEGERNEMKHFEEAHDEPEEPEEPEEGEVVEISNVVPPSGEGEQMPRKLKRAIPKKITYKGTIYLT